MLMNCFLVLQLSGEIGCSELTQISAAAGNSFLQPRLALSGFLASRGRRAPGPDHGDDPNDEQHPDLPNGGPDGKHYGDGYPSQDPYDDTQRNSRKPYPAPNNPY